MATSKKRINISIAEPLEKAVEKLAARDEVLVATKVAELVRLAVELDEDQVWDSIAEKRDTSDASFISHKKAWNN